MITFGASALFATGAQAADIGPYASPAPVETWTGFSVGIGGGIGILNADTRSKASRRDTIGICETDGDDCNGLSIDLLNIDQSYTSNLGDLSDTGGFFTVQGAYDYQFAPRWVVGGFVDADWSDIKASSTQASTASLTLLPNGVPDGVFGDGGDGEEIINFLTGLNTTGQHEDRDQGQHRLEHLGRWAFGLARKLLDAPLRARCLHASGTKRRSGEGDDCRSASSGQRLWTCGHQQSNQPSGEAS